MRRHARPQSEAKEEGLEAVVHLHVDTPDCQSEPKLKYKHKGSFIFNLLQGRLSRMTTASKQRLFKGSLILLSFVAVAGSIFELLSFYPCLYLCSWSIARLPKPPPPPPRTYEQRVAFVEDQVKKRRLYLPLTTKRNMVNGPYGGYDIYDCPMEPPSYYPIEFPIMDLLNHWPLSDTDLKDERSIHQGFCVFDFSRHGPERTRQFIHNYQMAEKPFVVKNDPEVLKTVERWNSNDYLDYLLQRKIYRGEFSRTLSMMYWKITRFHEVPADFVPPTRFKPTTFALWKERAQAMEDPDEAAHRRQDENSYLRLDGCESPHKRCDAIHRLSSSMNGIYSHTRVDDGDFLHDELPWFSPRYYDQGISKDYLMDPQKNRGMQCRFGAKGLIAEDHFDNERNFIAVLGGERRYLLGHPNNCKDMSLYPMAHPLERHSRVDWNAPNLTQFPNFEHVHINEVVLQAGDVLYLPTYWFHHIVSLNLNYQCNARSGHSLDYDEDIYDCGFLYPWPADA